VDQETNPASTTTEPASSPGSDTAPDVKSPEAASSPAPDVERKSLLDVVKSAVAPDTLDSSDEVVAPSAKAEPSTAEGEAGEEPAAAKPNGKDDVSDDALLATLEQLKGDVPLGKIERFREVLRENHQLRATAEQHQALNETLEDIGADARRMGLSNDDLAALFAWPRLLAKDPAQAVEQLRTFAAQWEERVGTTLPADLQKRVEDGFLDEASAKEVAKLRAEASLSKTRTAADEQDRERSSIQQRQTAIRDSVNSYQAELRANDPDYTPEKHAMTIDALTTLVHVRGVPTTVEDARAMAKEAYDSVTQRLKAFKPAPRSITSPSVGRRLNKPAESQPKSMREAIERAIE
jgi:hypothetical protein